MINIRTKLLIFFLVNAFFLCLIAALSLFYVEKISSSQEDTMSLKSAVDLLQSHSEDFLKISRLYSTADPDKFDAIKAEFDFSISKFDEATAILEKDMELRSYAPNIKIIRNKYADISEKIASNRKKFVNVNSEHAATIELLENLKQSFFNQSISEETKLLIAETTYNEKEFNFQYKDGERAQKWLVSIEKLKKSIEFKEERSDLLQIARLYEDTAQKCIYQTNVMIDLELNRGYYLAIIENVFMENKIQNSNIIERLNSKMQKTKEGNEIFKLALVTFILSMLAFASGFMILYSRKLTDSIENLISVSKKIMSGDLTVRSQIKTNDEMEYFSKTFNKMLDSISEKNGKLRNESAQLKILLSSISEGLLLIDGNYRIILANAAASGIFRMKNTNLKGMNLKDLLEILHDMDNIPFDKWPFEIVFRTQRPINLKLNENYYLKTREGRIFPIEMSIAPIEIGSAKGVIVVFKDTTEMKLIEEEREFSRKNLESVLKSIYVERDNVQEEKDKLEALLNSMGDAVLAVDEEKRIIAFNPVAEKITGLNKEKLEKGKFSDKIIFIEEESKKEKNDFIDSVLSGGEKVELNNLAIFDNKQKMVLVDINAAPIKNYKGKIIGCIIIFKDVTFKREAERMRTDFISIVSHQLRTPLSAMKWFLEILLDGDVGPLKKGQKEVVNEIQESNKSMINFVNQMLNVSRIESHHLAINAEEIKLCETIGELLKEIKPFFALKKQKLAYSCIANKNFIINTDRNLLRNVLSSVLLNASRYTPQKGKIELEVSIYNKDFVLFKVKDNGIGIPENEKAKIFRKFSRASNAIRYEANGTGLGLYIVKSIINMVCGKIWFESEESKGTTFYFTLPIKNMVCEIDEEDRKMLI